MWRCRSPSRWHVFCLDARFEAGGAVLHYTLLFYDAPENLVARLERGSAFSAAFFPYLKALKDAGILVARAALQGPDSATTVRLQPGKPLVQDGPYAETKEQLAGFFVIDVPDLDTALEWAARYPGKVVEVRPNLSPTG